MGLYVEAVTSLMEGMGVCGRFSEAVAVRNVGLGQMVSVIG